MGLLSRLSMFGQQSPWAVLAPQMQQAQQYPQQTQPSQEMVAAPRQTTAQLRPPTFTERFEGLMDNPLLQTGLSLLGNAQNGGDWGAVGRDMQQFGQQRRQEQRLRNEDRRIAAADARDQSMFDRARQGWGFEDQQRSAWQAAVAAETDPRLRAQLQAVGPQGYGDYLAAQAQRDFTRSENALDREEQRRTRAAMHSAQAASDAWSRRFQTALGAADAAAVAEQGALVRQGVTTVRPIIQEMRSIITQYPDIMGSWINTQDRTQMARLAGGDPQRLAAMERLAGLATQLTLPQLEALRPATNLDFERIRSTIADPQMSYQGAIAFLDSQDQSLDRASQVLESQGRWVAQYGSLSMPNENGQTWSGANAGAPFMQFNPGAGSGQPQQAAPSTPPPAAIQRLRSNPTERERQMFDEIFGRGASERYAPRRRTTPPRAAQGGRPGAF